MSKLVDDKSDPSTTSLLDLFTVPPTQVAIDSGYWHAAHLVNTCTSEGPWQFNVPSDQHYMHLGRNYLYMKLRIVKADGTNLQARATDATGVVTGDPGVGPIQAIAKTMFRQVKLGLNGKLAYDSGSMYAYRSFLETELNYSVDAKISSLKAGMYVKDGPYNQIQTTENVGWQARCKPFLQSRVVEVMAPLHCDLFFSDKLLISGTEVQLELHRNPDNFSLMCFTANCDNYKIEVMDMIWYIRKVQLASSVHMGIEATLQRHVAKYPIRRVEMTKLHISAGSQSAPTSAVFNGQIPRRIIVGFVSTDNYFGAYNKSPFMFEPHGVKEIAVHAGGHMFPREPLRMNYTQNQFVRPFVQLFEALGMADENWGNAITDDDFKTHLCLYAFDLSPEEQDVQHWQLMKEGTTSVHCMFELPITGNGLEMIVYAEFDNLAMIDRNRSIYFDYSV